MRIVQRYIFFELLKVFGLALGILTLLFILGGLVREAQEQGLKPAQVVQIIPFVLPDALRYTVPATLLLAASMVYGRMAGSNEITALKSLGISPMAVLRPMFYFAFVLSITTVWLNDVAVSWGRAGIRRVVLESIEEIAYGLLRTQKTYVSRHISIVVKRVDGRRLIQPTITFQSKGSAVTLSSEEAELRSDVDRGTLTIIARNGMLDVEGRGRMLFPNDVLEREVPLERGDTSAELSHPSYMAMREIPRALGRQRAAIDEQYDEMASQAALQMLTGDFADLHGAEWITQEAVVEDLQNKVHRLETEPHRRWSNGFSCLCFVLVGAPLAIRLRNADFLTSFFLCFGPILVVFYPLLAFGVDQAKSGDLPAYSVWIGNVVLAAAGAWIMRRVIRY
jgi:lipopolysaccharide export system permease protein